MKPLLIILLLVIKLVSCPGQTNYFPIQTFKDTLVHEEANRTGTAVIKNVSPVPARAETILKQKPVDASDPATPVTDNLYRDGDFLIYPIKTDALLNVVITPGSKKVFAGNFIDFNGKIVKAVVLDAMYNEINLKDFPNGAYLFRITSGNQTVTETSVTKENSGE